MHFLYIIHDAAGNTYNGYTVDLTRRLRQHNKEIKGGAKYTTSRVKGPGHWKYLITWTSPEFTYEKALSMEWSVKYPTNRRPRPRTLNGPRGRLESLPLVFSNPKFQGLSFDVTPQAVEYADLMASLLAPFQTCRVTTAS